MLLLKFNSKVKLFSELSATFIVFAIHPFYFARRHVHCAFCKITIKLHFAVFRRQQHSTCQGLSQFHSHFHFLWNSHFVALLGAKKYSLAHYSLLSGVARKCIYCSFSAVQVANCKLTICDRNISPLTILPPYHTAPIYYYPHYHTVPISCFFYTI